MYPIFCLLLCLRLSILPLSTIRESEIVERVALAELHLQIRYSILPTLTLSAFLCLGSPVVVVVGGYSTFTLYTTAPHCAVLCKMYGTAMRCAATCSCTFLTSTAPSTGLPLFLPLFLPHIPHIPRFPTHKSHYSHSSPNTLLRQVQYATSSLHHYSPRYNPQPCVQSCASGPLLPYRTVPLPYRDSRFLLNPNTWTLADIHPFPHQTRSSIAGTQVSANQTRYSPHCLHIPQKQLRLIGSYLDSEQNISHHTQKETFFH